MEDKEEVPEQTHHLLDPEEHQRSVVDTQRYLQAKRALRMSVTVCHCFCAAL